MLCQNKGKDFVLQETVSFTKAVVFGITFVPHWHVHEAQKLLSISGT